MNRKTKYLMACLLVVIASLLFAEEARAEKVFSEELTKIFGFGKTQCYVCGESTEDGVVQLKTNASSLEEGDTVEIQVFYNSSKAEHTLDTVELEMLYDTEFLEYTGYTFSDEHILKYGIELWGHSEDAYPDEFTDSSYRIHSIRFRTHGYNEDASIVNFQYKVKKKAESIRIDCMPIVVVQIPPALVKYFEEDGENKADVLSLYLTGAPTPSSALALSTTPAQGEKEITVPINLSTNDGFNLLGLEITYDASLFTYESLEIDNALQSKISLESIYEAPGSGNIKASFIALEDISGTGNFLKLKLKTKDGIPAGTVSNVGIGIAQVGNKAETAIQGTGATCAVSITGAGGGEGQQPALGDVNGDGKINLVDAVYILQHYNQAREFSNTQKTAADVDKNGKVDLVDALMIMKYFNGELTAF